MEQYPFVLGDLDCEFEALPYRLYMVSDTEFYVFRKDEETFTELYKFEDGTPYELYSERMESILFHSKPLFKVHRADMVLFSKQEQKLLLL